MAKELIKQIRTESERKLKEGNAQEMAEIIFDTLFHNNQFPIFDLEKEAPVVNEGGEEWESYLVPNNGEMFIGYMGHSYKVTVDMIC